jgi:hypothetical protein
LCDKLNLIVVIVVVCDEDDSGGQVVSATPVRVGAGVQDFMDFHGKITARIRVYVDYAPVVCGQAI